MPRYARGTASPNFWANVDKTGDCWIWTSSRTRQGGRAGTGGYGKWGGRMAHRVSYEALVSPIPEGLQLDHLCRTPACVNPQHLEPVTGAENLRRWQEANPYCKRGHALVGQNLRVTFKDGRPGRRCRTCIRMTNAAYEQRRRARRMGGLALSDKDPA